MVKLNFHDLIQQSRLSTSKGKTLITLTPIGERLTDEELLYLHNSGREEVFFLLTEEDYEKLLNKMVVN